MNFSSFLEWNLVFRRCLHSSVCIAWLVACGQAPETKVQPYDLIGLNDDVSDDVIDFGSTEASREPNSYIVMFRAPKSSSQLHFLTYLDEYRYHAEFLLNDHFSDQRVKKIQFITSVDLTPVDSKGARFTDFIPTRTLQSFWNSEPSPEVAGRLARIDFIDEVSSETFLQEAADRGDIWFAEPNYINQLMDSPVSNQIGYFDDAAKNYTGNAASWMKSILLPEAFTEISKLTTKPTNETVDAAPPIIAVLDTGLDYEHPGLKDRVWENTAKGAAGCTNDEHGCDTSNPEPGTLGNGNVFPCGVDGPSKSLDKSVSECGHGTHVSGIIAGNYSNGNGGVCPVCKIMTLKVVEMQGSKPKVLDSAILTGMKYLNRFRRSGNSAVRVINSSFGKFSRSRSVGILVDVLKRDGKGIILVGAAGNEDSMSRVYPAAFSEAIAVSALTDAGQKAKFSNFGPWVDIAAPGVSISSTVPGGQYEPKNGTSMACPVVAGAIGLYLSVNPNASADELKSLILRTADGGIYAEDFGTGDAKGYNNRNYFKKLTGESFRRPLLGAGQLDVSAFMTGKASDAYIGSPVDRVTPGCGALSLTGGGQRISAAISVLLILPIFLSFFSNRKRRFK